MKPGRAHSPQRGMVFRELRCIRERLGRHSAKLRTEIPALSSLQRSEHASYSKRRVHVWKFSMVNEYPAPSARFFHLSEWLRDHLISWLRTTNFVSPRIPKPHHLNLEFPSFFPNYRNPFPHLVNTRSFMARPWQTPLPLPAPYISCTTATLYQSIIFIA